MNVFGRQLHKLFNRPMRIWSFSSRFRLLMCGGDFKADFWRQSAMRQVSGACRRQLSAPVYYEYQRHYSTSHKTQCDVHKFGELRLAVGSWCDVTISSLDPQLYLDQNLVILDDSASRLCVDYHNCDGISRVSISESNGKETSNQNRQQSDVCNIEVPIKYGKLCHL